MVRAAITRDPMAIDGRLDEAAWSAAEPFEAFVELYPREGARPARGTELRVLHDDAWHYVGVRCRDEPAAEISRPLGRRDFIPSGSDTVEVPCTDVFALDAVLFEAATGVRPFALAQRRTDARHRRAPPVASARRVPAALARVVDGCLDPDPERRPPLERVREALQALAAGRERGTLGPCDARQPT